MSSRQNEEDGIMIHVVQRGAFKTYFLYNVNNIIHSKSLEWTSGYTRFEVETLSLVNNSTGNFVAAYESQNHRIIALRIHYFGGGTYRKVSPLRDLTA